MEDISNLPEIPQSNDDAVHEATPESAADWLLQHQSAPIRETEGRQNQTPLTYELDISPGNKATVEFEDTPELDFDRRHEILDESTPAITGKRHGAFGSSSRKTSSNQQPAQTHTQKAVPDSIQSKRTGTPSTQSIYRKALFWGFLAGVVVTILLVFWLKATGR